MTMASTRTTPPFRADHVGSLLRPPELLDARARHASGALDDDGLRAVEDEAIAEAVRMQQEVGLQGVTDGEFRRGSWHMDFIYALDGITTAGRPHQGHVPQRAGRHRVHGRRTPRRREGRRLADDLRRRVLLPPPSGWTTGVPKLTIPSPSMVHYRGGRAAIDESVYPDLDAFWSDLTAAYREEVRRLGELGCTYLQLDDTSLAYLNDPEQRRYVGSIGGDPDAQHVEYIRHINEALDGRPDAMSVTTHMCRGNFRSSWVAEGGYDHVAEALFNELEVDGFFMEWDDERSGGFEPLRFLPPAPSRSCSGS